MKSETTYFVSEEFQPEPREELETGPNIFGKQLAYWIKRGFEREGIPICSIQPQEWGRRINVKNPSHIWIGCSGSVGVEFSSEYFEDSATGITWKCFLCSDQKMRINNVFKMQRECLFLVYTRQLKRLLTECQDILIIKETR